MFEASVYVERRRRLAGDVGAGLVLLLGNAEAPINYRDNQYPFRQDSTFLYFFGLDRPDLAAVVDGDAGRAAVFGDDFTVDDIVWSGPRPTLADVAAQVGVEATHPLAALAGVVDEARRGGRSIHFLPPYRGDTALWLEALTGIRAGEATPAASLPLIRAIVAQRSVKSADELAEIEAALEITRDMQLLAMRLSKPGVFEREVAGAMEGVALARGGRLAFPTIFTTRGETLHNHYHGHRMEAGDLIVSDCGAESALHYAADTTRTIPVGGALTGVRRDLYEAVLRAQLRAIDAIRPGVRYRDVHLAAARSLAADLVALGCLRGDVEAAVAAGAHALFFPHGLGHMMGLDVHDMEHLGEDHVGYDATVTRSTQFGLKSLRFARQLEPGFVVTVEPGLYFIPGLIDQWRAEGRAAEFIDYAAVDRFRGAGGLRIEDDVVVTSDGGRVLGPPIPKRLEDVEATASA
ncbi:MAG: aminopeptidase P N-terminal domain-containing protein [Acidobacteria bacterium]|nr:aminopeptidase P N-terminal domain-containing protein [Acidobacteriota bacterium]